MSTENQPEWEEFEKILDKHIGNSGLAFHKDDPKRIGLYLTATDIGMAKRQIKSFIRSFALTLLDEINLDEEKHMLGHSETLGYRQAIEDLDQQKEAIRQKYGL